MSDKSSKTEEATPKKKKDARKKGHVAKSKEVSTALTFIGITLSMLVFSDYLVSTCNEIVVGFLNLDFNMDLSINNIKVLYLKAFYLFLKMFLPIATIIIVLGIVGNIAQTGIVIPKDALKPKLSNLNPINGFKNMFSMKSLGQLVKSVLIISILIYVGCKFMSTNFKSMLTISNMYIVDMPKVIVNLIYDLSFKICIVVVIVAALDFMYQKFNYKKDLKMTKQEIKDEYKEMEGDPHIKGRIRQRQREIAMSRMMSQVPEATVVITNPTHIAIAIKYVEGGEQAPIVVAKGADNVAKRIREKAEEHNIPIVQNIPLARLMYKKVELNQEIPEEMYQAVAEILVAVLKIKNDNSKHRRR